METNEHSSDLAYETIDVACYCPDEDARSLLRQTIANAGFRRVQLHASVHDLMRALDNATIEFLILDIDKTPDKICQIIREIRGGLLGSDPYVVILVLASDPEQETVKRAFEAGSDGLIAKPLMANDLIEHATKLVRGRRNFVVTTDYVGPDRRAPGREHPADLPTLQVPNALRHKAAGDPEAAADAERLTAARRVMREHLIIRIAARINDQVLRLPSQQWGAKPASVPASDQKDMGEHVRSMAILINEANLDDLKPLAESMVAITDTIVVSGRTSRRSLAILKLQSQAIIDALESDDGRTELISKALRKTSETLEDETEAEPRLFD